MVEPYLRQSALAHLGLAGRAAPERGAAGVALAERPFPVIVNLRGDPAELGEAFEAEFGFNLPTVPNTTAGGGELSALWLGPDEWWITAAGPDYFAGPRLAERLRRALAGVFHAVTDVSESRTRIRVSGPQARALLQKGCPLDLHPRAFAPGACAQSLIAKAGVVLRALPGASGADSEPDFEILVLRSYAEYLWLWLEDAAQEYGLAVIAEA